MIWRVADAKQRLSEVIRLAEKRPQVIYNRDTPVAAVVSAADLAAFIELREQSRHTLRDAVKEMVEIARDERYELPILRRTDRPNPLDIETPSRKKRRRRAPR